MSWGIFNQRLSLFPMEGQKKISQGPQLAKNPKSEATVRLSSLPAGAVLFGPRRPDFTSVEMLPVLSFFRWRRLANWSFLININTANTVSLIQILWLISLDFHMVWYGLTIVMLYLQSSRPLKSVHTKTWNKKQQTDCIVVQSLIRKSTYIQYTRTVANIVDSIGRMTTPPGHQNIINKVLFEMSIQRFSPSRSMSIYRRLSHRSQPSTDI